MPSAIKKCLDKNEKKYIEHNLIAYIGNKRRLLPLLEKAINHLNDYGSQAISKNGYFIDLFAGTGVVSRFAKSIGFRVISNDWEYYSYIINKSFIENNKNFFSLFQKEGGIEAVLNRLNKLTGYRPANSYIASYYCPQNDKNPDTAHERLFYTRQNGILIDNIRAGLDKLYPPYKNKQNRFKNHFLLSLLLYEASRRSNTSGVFKGFHNGFGGKGKDALKRILSPVKLEKPCLSSQKKRCKVFKSDAVRLAHRLKKIKAEVIYLDPPYNQHQYGSNYHLLNTIAKNDQPPVSKKYRFHNKVIDKSAIRKDWIKTRSSFCYRQSAVADFKKLVNDVNSKYLMISYSTEGIIPFKDMLDILAAKGRIGIVTTGYVRYRGGRQANTTKNKNIEFILLVDTALKCRPCDINNVKKIILDNNFNNIFEETFPLRLHNNDYRIIINENGYNIKLLEENITLALDDCLRLRPDRNKEFNSLDYKKKKKLYNKINSYLIKTNADEVVYLIKTLGSGKLLINRNYLLRRLIRLYRKINPQKNRLKYQEITALLKKEVSYNSVFSQNKKLLGKLKASLTEKQKSLTSAA